MDNKLAYDMGVAFALGRKAKKANDEDVWITTKKTPVGGGHHVLIDSETGEIKKGFGGKFTGQKLSDVKGDPVDRSGENRSVIKLKGPTITIEKGELFKKVTEGSKRKRDPREMKPLPQIMSELKGTYGVDFNERILRDTGLKPEVIKTYATGIQIALDSLGQGFNTIRDGGKVKTRDWHEFVEERDPLGSGRFDDTIAVCGVHVDEDTNYVDSVWYAINSDLPGNQSEGDQFALMEKLVRVGDAPKVPKDKFPYLTAVHETGHLLHNLYILKRVKEEDSVEKVDVDGFKEAKGQILRKAKMDIVDKARQYYKEMCAEAGKTVKYASWNGGISDFEWYRKSVQKVSTYALASSAEFFAECFCLATLGTSGGKGQNLEAKAYAKAMRDWLQDNVPGYTPDPALG